MKKEQARYSSKSGVPLFYRGEGSIKVGGVHRCVKVGGVHIADNEGVIY